MRRARFKDAILRHWTVDAYFWGGRLIKKLLCFEESNRILASVTKNR